MRKVKKISILLAIVLVMSFFLPACVNKGLIGGNDFHEKWYPSDMPKEVQEKLVGSLVDGAGGEKVWRSQAMSQEFIGYIDELILQTNNVKLKRGIYKFTANMSIDNNVNMHEGNNMENEVVSQLRIVDYKNNQLLAAQEIFRRDFKHANVFEPISMTFIIPSDMEVSLEAKYTNKGIITVESWQIDGAGELEHMRQDTEKYFFDAAEDNIAFSKDNLYYFDLYDYMLASRDTVFNYDVSNLVVTLQGLVNRDDNLMFIRFNAPNQYQTDQDNFWLDYLREEGKMLADKNLVTVKKPGTLLRIFKDYYKGLVVWDEKVPATVNVAATSAGVDNCLPVRYKTHEGSIYSILTKTLNIPVKLDLVGKFDNKKGGKIVDTSVDKTGSAKNDAYLWAVEKYLIPKKTHKTIMANHIDAYSWDKTGLSMTYYNIQAQNLGNKDYYIKNKAFFWDLSVWDDEAPVDDRGQDVGTDFATLDKIMTLQNEYANGELTVLGGFIPWWIKYCDKANFDSIHQDVQTEWRWAQCLGNYYAIKDADAYGYTSIANCSIYSRFKLKDSYKQTAKTDEVSVKERAAQYIAPDGKVYARNYLMQYMGDYDAAAWMAMCMPSLFRDPNRGSMPLGWPINAGPSDRFPVVFDFMYENAGPNDYFLGDHNGYGYIDLMQLNLDGRPDKYKGSLESYMALAEDFWEKFDLDIMGLLATTSPQDYDAELAAAISDLASGGVIVNRHAHGDDMSAYVDVKTWADSNGNNVVWTTEHDIGFAPPLDIAYSMTTLLSIPQSKPVFKTLRSICKTPTFINEVMTVAMDKNPSYKMTVVDPYVYMYLAEQYKINGGTATI